MKYEITDAEMRNILIALMFTVSPDVCIDVDPEEIENTYNTLENLSKQAKKKKFNFSIVSIWGNKKNFEEKIITPKIKKILKELRK